MAFMQVPSAGFGFSPQRACAADAGPRATATVGATKTTLKTA
jgi:hypothetical protein